MLNTIPFSYETLTFKDTLLKNKLFGKFKIINDKTDEIKPDDILSCIYYPENIKDVFPSYKNMPSSRLLSGVV